MGMGIGIVEIAIVGGILSVCGLAVVGVVLFVVLSNRRSKSG